MTAPVEAFDVPVRTEVEVAADAVWALIDARLLELRHRDEALHVVGIGLDDLRCASFRAERHRGEPTLALTAPAAPRDHPPGHRPPVPPRPPSPPAVPSLALASRKCRRCGIEKPTAEFPIRGGGLGWWCRPCANERSERIVRQNRRAAEALLAVRLHVGDACVGMTCATCGRPLEVGQTMVVQSEPRHEECP